MRHCHTITILVNHQTNFYKSRSNICETILKINNHSLITLGNVKINDRLLNYIQMNNDVFGVDCLRGATLLQTSYPYS